MMLPEITNQYQELDAWSQTFNGLSIKLSKLAHATSRKLRFMGHPVCVRCEYAPHINVGDILVSAAYLYENDDNGGHKYIEIVLLSNPAAKERITLDDGNLGFYAMLLIESLVHEYRHKHQYNARGFMHEPVYKSNAEDEMTKSEQEYMGMKIEVDAFAINIATRLWLQFEHGAFAHLAQGSQIPYASSPDYSLYCAAFGREHAVVKRLTKKVYKHLLRIQDCFTMVT